MRSPSGGAPGSTRGIAPVAIRTVSALISASPALTVPGPSRRPLALITLMPSAASRAVMSADWARARSVIRSYSRAALTVARPPVAMPSPADRLSRVIALDVSMSVLDGTQSVSTQAPPIPSESTTVTSAPSWAATRAASYPPGPPPRIAMVCRDMVSPLARVAVRYRARACPADRGGTPYACPRGTVRSLRQQHGPGADAPALPAFAPAGHRLAGRLAADLRRRGHRLGRGHGHGGRGARIPGVRRPLRHVLRRRDGARQLGRRDPGLLPQGQGPGADPGRRRAGLAVRAQLLRGRTALGAGHRHPGRLRGEGGRAAGLRDRAASAAVREDGRRQHRAVRGRAALDLRVSGDGDDQQDQGGDEQGEERGPVPGALERLEPAGDPQVRGAVRRRFDPGGGVVGGLGLAGAGDLDGAL